MSEFGDSVRQARIHRGLSQAELGRPHYSRSYISLVETGRRAPSDDIVEHFAERLGLDIEVIRSWALAEGDSGTTRAALAQSAVITALSRSSFDEAAEAASQLSEFALTADRLDLWWTAAMLDIDARIELGEGASAVEAAEELLQHWFTLTSPALTGRVQTALATALRITGDAADTDRATEVARRAADSLAQDPHVPGADVSALTTLASALAEAGRADEAIALIPDLRRSAEASTSKVETGKAFWTLGNLEFMRGDADTADADHRRAAAAIDPNHELRRWGRLHRASASMRLTHGVKLDDVPELLAKAEAAFGISAGPGDLAALALAQGHYAMLQEDCVQARSHLVKTLEDADSLIPSLVVEAHQLLARALQGLGEHEEAARHLTIALDLMSDRSTLSGPAV